MTVRLLHEHEVPRGREDLVFLDRSWQALLGAAAAMLGLTLFLFIAKLQEGSLLLVGFPLFVTLFLGGLGLARWWECRRPRNWLLRAAPGGLYVNLRSYKNYHLPRDWPTAVFLPRDAVAVVCKTLETRNYPRRHGGYTKVYVYLDVYLREDSLEEVRQTLHRERRIEGPRKRDVYPVRSLEPAGLRLVWDWIRPGETKAMALLGDDYPLGPDQETKTPKWEKLSKEEVHGFAARLWEEGEVRDAWNLLRYGTGKTSQEARDYFAEQQAREEPA